MRKAYLILLFYSALSNAQNTSSFDHFFKVHENAITISAPINDFILKNTKPYSFMVGFNSNRPSLYVGPSNGFNTTGDVGIGTVHTNGFKLNVAGDVLLRRLCIGGEYIPEDCLLAVEGKLICADIQVTDINEWPDYVFDENYELITIEEMGDYIQKENHLPGIPTNKEINENGIGLAELNLLLLKKIEELSLYTIKLNNELKKIKSFTKDTI